MIRISRWVAFAALAMGAGGCKTVILTARATPSPVLLGPVKTIGPPTGAGRAAVADNVRLSLVRELGSAAGPGTGGAGPSGMAQSTASAETEFDWEVLLATKANPARWVEVRSARCAGSFSYGLLWIYEKAACELEGDVYAPVPAPPPRTPLRPADPAPPAKPETNLPAAAPARPSGG